MRTRGRVGVTLVREGQSVAKIEVKSIVATPNWRVDKKQSD